MGVPSVFEAKREFGELCALMAQLCDRLRASAYDALIHELPVMAVAHRQRIIPISTKSGTDAIEPVLEALSTFYRLDNQDPKSAVRFPGYIRTEEDLSDLVKKINAQKDVMAAISTSFDNNRQRREFMRQALPNVSAHHMTRHVTLLANPPTSVGFTWSGFSTIVRKMTLAEVEAEIIKRSSTGMMSDMDHEALGRAREPFYERRVMAPHPLVNLSWLDPDLAHKRGQSGVFDQKPASIPLIIKTPRMHHMRVTELTDFVEADAAARTKRSDIKSLVPVLPHLDIYCEEAS